MKINNKGFAITSIIYSMLILFLTLVILIIANLASRKVVFDKQKEDLLDKFTSGIENGTIVYFDVTKGKVCNDYHEDNSKIGYNGTSSTNTTPNQNGCLKFYIFTNYENSQRFNLLLDHNTSTGVNWDDSGDNQYGPRTALEQLQEDTGSWIGTEQPANYTDTVINKTIDYSGYKARLITASDIYNITGVNNLYFFTADGNETETCKEGDNSGCLYRWLYDRLSCDISGNCGYWAADAYLHSVEGVAFARLVRVESFNANGVTETSYRGIPVNGGGEQGYGLRPVIEVLKEKIKPTTSFLPSEEYQQVEYIKSTGTQYIDTGFKPTINTKVSTNLKFEEYQGYAPYNSRIFGATDYTNDTGFSINFGQGREEQNRLIIWTGKPYNNYKEQYDDSDNNDFPVNSIVVSEDTVLNKNEMILTSDSFKYGTQTMDIVKTDATKWATNKVDKNMLILAASTPFSIYKYVYIYDFKIYDNNVLVRNFIPCYRKSDNVPGLYDLVNNVFYSSAGTDEFEKGANV